jgi:ubiquinone/menaquinone biosynthesis C-methylase UbiE
MASKDPTQRFSSRVENYTLHRPGYPVEALNLLRSECRLTPDSVIADIASGTGIFTRMLLENGNRVIGVEPNPEMRRAGEKYLADFKRFTSVTGTAEATTLAAQSVDIITAAQAAHWFDRETARREFVRILKPGGWLVLLWNERRTDSTPFLRAYERLLQTYGTDYHDVRHERATATIDDFFSPSPFQSRVFQTRQDLDYAALEGRLRSSSYTPEQDDVRYSPMLLDLNRIFEAHQMSGKIVFEYDTRVFYGRLD